VAKAWGDIVSPESVAPLPDEQAKGMEFEAAWVKYREVEVPWPSLFPDLPDGATEGHEVKDPLLMTAVDIAVVFKWLEGTAQQIPGSIGWSWRASPLVPLQPALVEGMPMPHELDQLHPKFVFKKHGNGIHPPICFLFKCVS
jgi:hypothetical protein